MRNKMVEIKFDQDRYRHRIQYSEEAKPTVEHLKAVHRAHLFSIPFENFDICLNREISLAPDRLFQKMVLDQRGGYCFEVNGLFLMALQAFGFNARALLGRAHHGGSPTGRGHQVSLITIQGRQWIADVGFGAETVRSPFPLAVNEPVTHDGQISRLVENPYFGFMLQKKIGDSWENLFSSDLEHVCQDDIRIANYFTSTHPDSFFTQARVAVLPVREGVITLFNQTLKKVLNGRESQIELKEGQAYIDALKTHFGIELDATYDEFLPLTR